MKIKMVRTVERGGQKFNEGNTYDVGDEAAREFVAQGLATYVEKPKSEAKKPKSSSAKKSEPKDK